MKKWAGCLMFLVSPFLWAETPAEILQHKLNNIKTMQANFSQVVKAKRKTVSTSSGRMAVSRPGCFRWQTTSPMKQLIVADGKKIWIYDVELEQVTVKKQGKRIGGTAGLFLSSAHHAVSRDFTVQQTNKDGMQVFVLHSKLPKDNFQKVTLGFEKDKLKTMQLYDQLGQITDLHFNNMKQNGALSRKICVFSPPKGVDVVRQ